MVCYLASPQDSKMQYHRPLRDLFCECSPQRYSLTKVWILQYTLLGFPKWMESLSLVPLDTCPVRECHHGAMPSKHETNCCKKIVFHNGGSLLIHHLKKCVTTDYSCQHDLLVSSSVEIINAIHLAEPEQQHIAYKLGDHGWRSQMDSALPHSVIGITSIQNILIDGMSAPFICSNDSGSSSKSAQRISVSAAPMITLKQAAWVLI